MTVPVVPLALGASALGLGLWWWLGGFHTGATTATALGSKDGCARGTADGLAGKTADQAAADLNNPGPDRDAYGAAAQQSGDAKAYGDAYRLAHADCFAKNKKDTTQDSLPVTLPPAPPPDKPPSTPAEWYLDRVNALNDWYTWSRKGAQEGYNEYVTDYEYRSFGTKTAKAAARSCGYAEGWALGKLMKDMLGSLTPTTLKLNDENTIFADCATKFDGWYDAHKHDKAAGGGSTSVSGAVVGWMRRTEVGGRALVGQRVIFRLQPAGGAIRHYSPGPSIEGAAPGADAEAVFRCMAGMPTAWSNDNEALWNAYRCAGGYPMDKAAPTALFYQTVANMKAALGRILIDGPMPADRTQRRRLVCQAAVELVARERALARRGLAPVVTAGAGAAPPAARRPTDHPLGWPAPPVAGAGHR
jgi:hypothetical protein